MFAGTDIILDEAAALFLRRGSLAHARDQDSNFLCDDHADSTAVAQYPTGTRLPVG